MNGVPGARVHEMMHGLEDKAASSKAAPVYRSISKDSHRLISLRPTAHPARESRPGAVSARIGGARRHAGDLFPASTRPELRYLMKRARRTDWRSQVDLARPGQVLHLALTVSALPGHERRARICVVLETPAMLRAQKARPGTR